MTSKPRRRKKSPPPFASRLAGYSATATVAVLGASLSSADAVSGNISLTQNYTGSATFLDFTRSHTNVLEFDAGPLHAALSASSSLTRSTGDFVSTTTIRQGAHFGAGLWAKYTGGAEGSIRAFALGAPLNVPPFERSGMIARRTIISTNSVFSTVNSLGPLGAGGTRYFGFKVNRNGTDYYGWLRVSLQVNGNHELEHIAFVHDDEGIFGAFMSVNDPGFATFGAGVTVPEPSTVVLTGLGLLALGARGVRTLRKRRKANL